MNELVAAELDSKRPRLIDLCQSYGVATLEIFGSGTTDDWRPASSDFDFLVAFHAEPTKSLADRYLGLAQELERLFGRPVDLIRDQAIRNPYFRRAVDTTRRLIYAA